MTLISFFSGLGALHPSNPRARPAPGQSVYVPLSGDREYVSPRHRRAHPQENFMIQGAVEEHMDIPDGLGAQAGTGFLILDHPAAGPQVLIQLQTPLPECPR